MISLNTNLSSLIAQSSLKNSTNILNQAVERMTTGYKINHAKDNAANYSIATNMTTKMSALQVAEDNAYMGLDLLTTASDNLSLIQDRVQRLRDLQEQASNATYGNESLRAINAECNAIIDEINRIYESVEYNGISLFMESELQADGSMAVVIESDAKLDTTFRELGVTSNNFDVYDSSGNLVHSYELNEDDNIQDFFDILQTHGFTTRLFNGEITINSTINSYITGGLVNEFGIKTQENINEGYITETITILTTTTTDTTQTSTLSVTTTIMETSVEPVIGSGTGTYYSEALYIDGTSVTASTTMFELGMSESDKYYIYRDSGGSGPSSVATITSSMTFSDIANVLGSIIMRPFDASIEEGVFYINSNSTGNQILLTDYSDGYLEDNFFYEFLSMTKLDFSRITDIAIIETPIDTVVTENTITETIYITTTSSTTHTTTVWSTDTISTTQTAPRLTYNSIIEGVFAPGTIGLFIGIEPDPKSNIDIDISFDLEDTSRFRGIGIDDENYLKSIDELLSRVASKQVEYGAVQNRLESALDSIATKYDNLASSRSTIRNADIAEVSASYIQQQILQEAAATLMSTANQSPAIALQLI